MCTNTQTQTHIYIYIYHVRVGGDDSVTYRIVNGGNSPGAGDSGVSKGGKGGADLPALWFKGPSIVYRSLSLSLSLSLSISLSLSFSLSPPPHTPPSVSCSLHPAPRPPLKSGTGS